MARGFFSAAVVRFLRYRLHLALLVGLACNVIFVPYLLLVTAFFTLDRHFLAADHSCLGQRTGSYLPGHSGRVIATATSGDLRKR